MFTFFVKRSSTSNNENREKFVDVGKSKFLKNFKKITITLYLMFIAISYYIVLPPINLKSMIFYTYAIFILGIGTVIFYVDSFFNDTSKKIYKLAMKIIAVMVLAIVISNIYSSPIFHAKRYSSLINKQDSIFEEDLKQADFSKLPVVDRDTAIKLGARKMGEMGSLVSQYNIDETYSQISIGEKPYRITPLVYADFIKWFLNKDSGIPYYIKIDMATQDSRLVKLENPIKYSMSDKFSRNLYRHIRFNNPTSIIADINFETDDNGKPYFVAVGVEPTIGLFGGIDTRYVLVVDATDGKIEKYNIGQVPDWIDRVYPADMITTQLVDNGRYERGFINSKIKQEGVTKPTAGYNYLSIGNDIYYYTGITSVLSDESNIGFVLVNMRTKDTKFYPVSSAEEFSVMQSAQGAVQEKGYEATFPILINMYNRPTYFMALKDSARLTKMFSLVDAQSYQKVAVGATLDETIENYKKISMDIAVENTEDVQEKTINVVDVKSVVIDGNTMYYVLADDNILYVLNAQINPRLAFIKATDVLDVKGALSGDVFMVQSVDIH